MIKNLDEYLETRAERNEIVGSWGFNSNLNFSRMSAEETNVWFFEQVFNFLRSFFGIVVPDSMEVITYNATEQVKKQDLDQQTFLDELMLVMKGLKDPLWTIRINLNIVGFLRTENNPADTVRIQIKEPSTFIVWGGPDETGFQSFSISYNLFSKTVLEGDDQMLWSMNQPVLEKALRKWEDQTGMEIDVVDSNASHVPIQKYGFGRPGSKPQYQGSAGSSFPRDSASDPFNFGSKDESPRYDFGDAAFADDDFSNTDFDEKFEADPFLDDDSDIEGSDDPFSFT